MMRRRRPWWALLAAATLMVASLLAPMDGAAYRVMGGEDPVGRGAAGGDPDDPDAAPATVQGKPQAFPAQYVLVVQAGPGFVLRISLRIPDALAVKLLRMRVR
jgi:hypothetical protein